MGPIGRLPLLLLLLLLLLFKGIYIAQVRKGHTCAMSAQMAVWLRNCSYLHN